MSGDPRTAGNIGARGCRRRRAGGYLWAAATAVALAAMLRFGAPRAALLALALPVALAALGFLQAREETCVFHAALGTRENDDGVVKLDPALLPEVRRTSWRIAGWSVAIAIAVTAAIYAAVASR